MECRRSQTLEFRGLLQREEDYSNLAYSSEKAKSRVIEGYTVSQ